MRLFLPVLAAAVAAICVSCATQAKTMPSAADLDRSQQRFRTQAQPLFDDLERRRASGTLSQAEYEREKSSLEYRVHQQAVDAAWTAHALAESDRKATGIPTPDSPQQIQTGSVSGSFYQSHNDLYGSQGAGLTGAMSQGSQSGGSIFGSRGGSY